jgi:hypothetical protein
LAEVGVSESFQIVAILREQRLIEAKRVTQLHDFTGGRAFTEHLLDGIARDNVDHQENEREDEPKRR